MALSACQTAPALTPLPTVAVVRRELPPTPVLLTPEVLGSEPALVLSATAPTSPARSATTLLPGWHVDATGSYTTTESESVGLMWCRIDRGSPAFGLLARLTESEMIFNQWEEGVANEDNRLIHPALVLPLLTLNEQVKAEWGGEVKLLITAAYDSTRTDHDTGKPDLAQRYSMHFDGRALDIVPLPVSQPKQDRLCWLAHEAGFSWVHNEGDHCHVSLATPSLCEQASGSAP